MDLQMLQNLQEGASVEETIKGAVRGKTPEGRLDIIMELVGMGLEAEERAQEVVVKAWELILREEWWRARYETLREFMAMSGMAEGVGEIIERRQRTESKKRSFEVAAARRWAGKDLATILGASLMPPRASKRFLEVVNTLSIQLPDVKEAVELLEAARDSRLKRPGKRDKEESLLIQDIQKVLQGLNGRSKRARAIEPTGLAGGSGNQAVHDGATGTFELANGTKRTVEHDDGFELAGGSDRTGGRAESQVACDLADVQCDEAQGTSELADGAYSAGGREGTPGAFESAGGSDEEGKGDEAQGTFKLASSSEGESDQGDEPVLIGKCKCKDITATNDLIGRVRERRDLNGKVGLLAGMHRRDWVAICHPHIRVIASSLELQTGIPRPKLIESVMSVQGKDADEVWKTEEGRSLFRKKGLPAGEGDELGPFKYAQEDAPEFEFDREAVWRRYAGEGAMETFFDEGNVVVEGALDWIVKDAELMGMASAEFEMYRHHLREQNGKANLGWCRNMWHSLVQQAIRQDPAVYALHVAAREDGIWRLVSHPYYTRLAEPGDSTGFRHIDINIPELISNGRGMSLVQSAVSLDDESESGCTLVVPGFHKHIASWWSKVKERGEETHGWTHDVGKIYKREDIDAYGDFETVKCGRGDMRMTMGRLIHGSTASYDRVRRVVFPWLLGIKSDHDRLEMTGLERWEAVHRANRDMVGLRKEPTGQPHRFGIGSGRFAGCVELRGVSKLGDAVLGLRKWVGKDVRKERDIVLGADSDAAWRYVNGVRAELKRRWKECFREMVEQESAGFGRNSFFKSFEGLCAVAGLDVDSMV